MDPGTRRHRTALVALLVLASFVSTAAGSASVDAPDLVVGGVPFEVTVRGTGSPSEPVQVGVV